MEIKPKGEFLFAGCPDMRIMPWPNAHQDIAVTQLKIFLPSSSFLLWSYDRNDAALFIQTVKKTNGVSALYFCVKDLFSSI